MLQKKCEALPVSQKDLAAYGKVSVTLLSMTVTGRHGNRKLPDSASARLTELEQAHELTLQLKADGPSVQKVKQSYLEEVPALVKMLARKSTLCDQQAAKLSLRLADLTKKEKEDGQWLNTVDRLLANLPTTAESKGDRVWLKYQQVLVKERLKKNNFKTHMKLELQVALELARVRIYNDAISRLQLLDLRGTTG